MNLHTEPIPPYIILRKDPNSDYSFEVRPASLRREFLDNTLKGHGYHCQPLTTAVLHGWEFILPQDVEVIWDGISNTESTHVKILKGQKLPSGKNLIETSTANSTISFNLDTFFETDENHYVLLLGPANHFIKGAKPMSALIRSDWYHFQKLQYCWIITTPNKPILFPKGSPFLTVVNYPKNLLETTNFYIKDITKEQKSKMEKYSQDRKSFYDNNLGMRFPMMYKKGIDGLSKDSNIYIDKTFKPKPKDIFYE